MSPSPQVSDEVEDRAQFLQEVLATSSDIVFIKGKDGRYIAGNKAHADLCGVPEAAVIGATDRELHGDDETVAYVLETDRQVLETGEPHQATGLPINFRGSERWFDILKSPLRDREGQIVGVIGVARDITRLHQVEQRLSRYNTWLEHFNVAVLGVAGSQNDGVDLDALLEPAAALVDAEQALLYSESTEGGGVDLVASFGERTTATDAAAAQVADAVWRRVTTSADLIEEFLAVPVGTGNDRSGVLIFQARLGGEEELRTAQSIAGQLAMLNAQVQLVREIEQQSVTDQLTGLGNRRLFTQRLEAVMEEVAGGRHAAAVVFMDLDDFKEINDVHGHHQGDLALRHVAACLRSASRDGDTVARVGGDEFALIAPGVGPADVDALCERLRNAFDAPIAIGYGDRRSLGVSMGAACAPESGLTPTDVLTAADKAMYDTKRRRKANEG